MSTRIRLIGQAAAADQGHDQHHGRDRAPHGEDGRIHHRHSWQITGRPGIRALDETCIEAWEAKLEVRDRPGLRRASWAISDRDH